MCQQCNYQKILAAAGLDATVNRIHILEAIGNNSYPLTATDVFNIVGRAQSINRVTVYRILDLLVAKKIVERLNVGSRAAYYGLAPNENHAPHPHFYCTRCGQMDCLHAESIDINAARLQKTFPGEIKRVEVRVDGICKNCLKQQVN
ncbi:MAG: Fur family transcriptional regulator [Desulforhopalus sp.]